MKSLHPKNIVMRYLALLLLVLCFSKFSFADCAVDCRAAYDAATQACAAAHLAANQNCDNLRTQKYLSAAETLFNATKSCEKAYEEASAKCGLEALERELKAEQRRSECEDAANDEYEEAMNGNDLSAEAISELERICDEALESCAAYYFDAINESGILKTICTNQAGMLQAQCIANANTAYAASIAAADTAHLGCKQEAANKRAICDAGALGNYNSCMSTCGG